MSSAEEANAIFEEFHCSQVGGHCGVEKTHSAIISRYYWPGMEKDIRKWVSGFFCLFFSFCPSNVGWKMTIVTVQRTLDIMKELVIYSSTYILVKEQWGVKHAFVKIKNAFL